MGPALILIGGYLWSDSLHEVLLEFLRTFIMLGTLLKPAEQYLGQQKLNFMKFYKLEYDL